MSKWEIIEHSKGPWKKHKYIKKEGDRYIYQRTATFKSIKYGKNPFEYKPITGTSLYKEVFPKNESEANGGSKPWVSNEYKAEVAYNSRKNVYSTPNSMRKMDKEFDKESKVMTNNAKKKQNNLSKQYVKDVLKQNSRLVNGQLRHLESKRNKSLIERGKNALSKLISKLTRKKSKSRKKIQ